MKSDYYENNLALLKEYRSEIYDAIVAGEVPGESNVIAESEEARDGSVVTKLSISGKEYHLNSIYNPVAEADKFIAQYEDRVIDNAVMIIYGIGNGIIAGKMVEDMPKHIKFMFYEPSLSVFLYAIHAFDMSTLIKNKRTIILVNGINAKYLEAEIMLLVNFATYKYAFFDAMPKYKIMFPEEYEHYKERYSYVVNLVKTNVGTGIRFAKETAINNIYNMRHIIGGCVEDDFSDVFNTDLPAIVISAGPSLEKNVGEIMKAKGRALIIAVDTAIKYLVSNGVYPDVAVTADPQKPVLLFDVDGAREIPLAIHTSVNYEAVDVMSKGRIIFMSADCAYYNKMCELAGKNMYTIGSGGSVSTLALSLAVAWGFRRIVLVGQDLALSNENRYAGKIGLAHDKVGADEKTILVPGYYGGEVYTALDYAEYIKWFEMIIANDDDLEVINATEGGAMIKGAIQMPLKEVIEKYCIEDFDYSKTIAEMEPVFDESNKDIVINLWKKSVDNLDIMKSEMKRAISTIDSSVHMFEKGQCNIQKVKKAQKLVDQVVKNCEAMEEIYFVDRVTAAETEDILADIYETEPDNDKEYCRMITKMGEYLKKLSDAVDEVKDMFEKIISDVE